MRRVGKLDGTKRRVKKLVGTASVYDVTVRSAERRVKKLDGTKR